MNIPGIPPSILLVEDEALVALDMECTLVELGWRVAGSLSDVTETLSWLSVRNGEPTAALLDVNLGGEMVFPVADVLQARQIPFAFATGYSDLVARSAYAAVPTLIKPVDHDRLKEVLDGLLDQG